MDNVAYAHLVDDVCMASALVLPIVFIKMWRRAGVVLGTLSFWVILIFAGAAISRLDPNRGFNLDGLWFFIGWVPSLFYSGVILAVFRFIDARRSRGHEDKDAAGQASSALPPSPPAPSDFPPLPPPPSEKP